MASAGSFTIQEMGNVGGGLGQRLDGAEGEIFEWTSDRRPQDQVRGGARAIPRKSWKQGGNLRTVRTDYPGAKVPSEQILGPQHKNHVLTGRWDDRYNFPGYANAERDRFEAMCFRGNMIRFSFQDQNYEGVIVDWEFDRLTDYKTLYQFSVSVHSKGDGKTKADRVPDSTRTATEAFDEMSDIINAMNLRSSEKLLGAQLESQMDREAADSVKTALADQSTALGNLEATLLKPVTSAISPLRRVATGFRALSDNAGSLLLEMAAYKSDAELKVRTALSVLQFEDWSRSMRFDGRLVLGQGSRAASEMDERAAPDATRIYKPHQGESLYQISRRFYGTPHSWRLIADRNGLEGFELDGTEILIIPEKGTG